MTVIEVIRKDNLISNVNILGHSNYDLIGKDIVCSSISSIVITTINGIIAINKDYLKYQATEGKIRIEVINNDEVCNKLLENMILLLSELATQYPKNVTLK